MTTRTVRLGSSSMVSSPGMIAWAIAGYRFKRDRKPILKVMQSWQGLTDAEWHAVLTGKIPHQIIGDTVEIVLP